MSATRANVVAFPVERTRPRQLVDLAALIEQFKFSERWWRYRISEGLPCHRWGKRLRFDPVEVERWLKERYG